MLKPVTMLLTTMAVLSPPAPAHAKPEQVSRRVSYADLNLSTEAGQRQLQHRIGYAVRQICGEKRDVATSYELAMQSKCEKEARSSSRKQVADAISRATTGQPRQETASR